jgi:DNA-directed RNA polymerase subunit RPC12/RpoP
MEKKICLECYSELEEVALGEYKCPECLATYYDSDFVEEE